MPNPNAPYGLRPLAFMSGAPYNGAVRTYYVPASNPTALFLGDPVITITNSSDGNGVPTVQIASAGAGNMVLGAMQGISNNAGPLVITLQQTQPVYLPAGQAAYIYVSDDPNLLYSIQEDSGAGTGMVSGAPQRNANLLAGTGNTQYGLSQWQLQTSSLNITANFQLRIIQLLQGPTFANTIGPNAQWLVKLNQGIHPWTQATGI